MELNIKDRIYIPQLLPQMNGSFMDFNLKREIVKKVSLTEKDRETYEMKEDTENNRITWNVEKDREIPLVVEFSKEEIKYLRNACENLPESSYPDDFWAVVEKIYGEANK